MDMEELCRVCGQTRRWHMEHSPHHAFSVTSAVPALPAKPATEPARPRLTGDLVLRLTLLKKGIVTDQELEETKVWLESAAEMGKAVILEPESDGFRFKLVTEEELIQDMVEGRMNAASEVQGAG